jgi:hypothetical protein
MHPLLTSLRARVATKMFSRTTPLWVVGWVAAAFILFLNPSPNTSVSGPETSAQVVAKTENPSELSAEDRGGYMLIRAAHERGDFASADELIAQLSNRLLVGHMLAERFLEHGYKPSAAQSPKRNTGRMLRTA